MTQEILKDSGFYYFSCPHCDRMIQVQETEVFCRMFVCGVYKGTNQQVNPHISEMEANQLKSKPDEVVGCLGAFFFDGTNLSKRNYG